MTLALHSMTDDQQTTGLAPTFRPLVETPIQYRPPTSEPGSWT